MTPKSTLSQADLARALKVSPAMVSKLARRGMPTHDLAAATAWRATHLDPRLVKAVRPRARKGNGRDAVRLLSAKRRREEAAAATAELDLALRRGDLVRKREVDEAIGARLSNLRDELLSVASRAGAEIGLTRTQIVKLDAYIRQAMRHIAASPPKNA